MKLHDLLKSCEAIAEQHLSLFPTRVRKCPNTDGLDVFTCAWIRFALSRIADLAQLEGIILPQDWGLWEDGWSIEQGIASIERDFREPTLSGVKTPKDRTTRNLVSSPDWRAGIVSGRWLVTNAVWGLRLGDKECGYLGSKIHAAGVAVWLPLVVEVARQVSFQGRGLRVVFAGEWAKFGSHKWGQSTGLQACLQYWSRWARAYGESPIDLPAVDNVQGTAWFYPHPAVWHRKKYRSFRTLPSTL